MGYLHTRRYVINIDSDEELFERARAYLSGEFGDEESLNDLNKSIADGAGVMAASELLCSSADVGDNTDVVQVLDEWVEPSVGNIGVYFS